MSGFMETYYHSLLFLKDVNIIAKNEGKRFEDAFIKSVPGYVLVKRLNDNASSWSGGTNTRFASKNECDYILFNDHTRTFYGLEMKSTKHSSLTFWREDFEDKSKKIITIKIDHAYLETIEINPEDIIIDS